MAECSVWYVGIDLHKDWAMLAAHRGWSEAVEREQTLPSEWVKMKRYFERLLKDGPVRACYEAGGCGYGLARRLREIGAYRRDGFGLVRRFLERESIRKGLVFEIAGYQRHCLEGLAAVALVTDEVVSEARVTRAARLLGAAATQREALGTPVLPIERPVVEGAIAAARARLGDEAFALAWAEGQVMTLEHASASALDETSPPNSSVVSGPPASHGPGEGHRA